MEDQARAQEAEDHLEEAAVTLRAAEELLLGDEPRSSISTSFLAMLHAAQALLLARGIRSRDWGEVMERFQVLTTSGLPVSPENRRALVIVAQLYRQVELEESVEADSLTARACLEDARRFVLEMRGLMGKRDPL
jgi:uncharacterized protein (UPF0332 family)